MEMILDQGLFYKIYCSVSRSGFVVNLLVNERLVFTINFLEDPSYYELLDVFLL